MSKRAHLVREAENERGLPWGRRESLHLNPSFQKVALIEAKLLTPCIRDAIRVRYESCSKLESK